MIARLLRFSCLMTSALILATANVSAQNVEKEWRRLLTSCGITDSDLVDSKRIIFLGPSNSIRLGQTFRASGEGYDPIHPLSRLVTDAAIRDKAMLPPGNEVGPCTGARGSSWEVKAGVSFISGLFKKAGLAANLKLSKAKSVTVTAERMAQDGLDVGFLETYFGGLKSTSADYPAFQAASCPKCIIIARGFRAKKLTLTFTLKPNDLDKLKEKLPAGNSLEVNASLAEPSAKDAVDTKQKESQSEPKGNAVTFSFQYQGKTELVFTAEQPGDVYYSAEYRQLKPNGEFGLVGSRVLLKPLTSQDLKKMTK